MIQLPRLRFVNLPTPIHPMPRLSTRLGGPELWIKRDDLTGLALGGNKTRKLEFLVAEAQANGAKTLITAGAMQSNHCRQTAAIAARMGMDCILVLSPSDQSGLLEPHQFSGNLLLDHLFDAEIVIAQTEDRDKCLNSTYEIAWENGRRPYLIPYGGSTPLGAYSYALAIQEMLDQEVKPDYIIFPTSSGGTQAGMVAGAKLYSYEGNIYGISVDSPANILSEKIRKLSTGILEFLGKDTDLPEVHVNADYLGGGYGVFAHPEREAILLFARNEGILLDPVYTGRAGAGLIDLVRKGFFRRDQLVLFWHTGGTPALFETNYAQQLLS